MALDMKTVSVSELSIECIPFTSVTTVLQLPAPLEFCDWSVNGAAVWSMIDVVICNKGSVTEPSHGVAKCRL